MSKLILAVASASLLWEISVPL
ncbi:hypothetical protein PENARI_c001G01038 [Penicillium arizonense]|uniref:Uncharacterized protein n=1 Tax=Penicillium arizonense TaxID=1835702 RepID=A0A1F5LZD2_PENAI|nr:hypothetical protein PENARI_c001G01038 [Penicillium arizonense]